jgi:hypothetical protein
MKISNSVVGLVILAALVVSVSSTMTTLNTLNQISLYLDVPDTQEATGYISGLVNVTVNESVVMSWLWAEVNFTLNLPGTGLNYTDNTTDWDPNPFVMRNDGAVNANISLYATGDLFTQTPLPTPNFRYMCGNNTSTCDTDGGDPASQVTWNNMTVDAANDTLVVWNLSALDTIDEIEIEINVTVPANEPTGDKTATIVFTGTQSCPGDDYCNF